MDYTESRRLRPLSAKRVREELVDYESDEMLVDYESGRASYSQIKAEFEIAFRKLAKIRQSKNPFGEALIVAKDQAHDQSSTTPEALRLIEGSWTRGTNKDLRQKVNSVTLGAFNEVFQKMTSDWTAIRDLPISDSKFVEWTNRKVESAFAYLKSCDRKFSTMLTANVQMTALSKMNHISSWLQSNRHREVQTP